MTSNEKEEAAADFSTFLVVFIRYRNWQQQMSVSQKSFHAAGARIPLEQYK